MIELPWSELFFMRHISERHPNPDDFYMHAHERFEIMYFISGNIVFWIEGTPYHPRPKDILLFNIAETHKVVVNPDTPYERIIIQINKNMFCDIDPGQKLYRPFTSRPLGAYNIISPDDFNDNFWEACINKLSENSSDRRLQVISNLLPFLNELNIAFENSMQHSSIKKNRLPSRIVNYINNNITEPLTSEDISKEFFISHSKLYSVFKKTTGSSVREYITVKRLLLAKDLLNRGEKPVQVYTKCGFNDYTTFFRAYKQKFGVSPKNDVIKHS